MKIAKRIRNCLQLGAYGDALGSAYEGRQVPKNELLSLRQITDDTQLTLATCEAIAEAGEVSPQNIAAAFVRWYRQRRLTGLGASTLKALTELEAGQHWALAGAKGERSAGNGAAMRIAPLAFCLNPFADDDRRTLRDVCRITHQHDEAYLGALAIAQAIHAVLNDHGTLDQIIPLIASSLPDSQIRDRLQELAPLRSQEKSIAEIAEQFGNSGFVAESIPFAIYAASLGASSPLRTLEEVVRAGGDADTNASLTGQIIGVSLDEMPGPIFNADLEPAVESFISFVLAVKN